MSDLRQKTISGVLWTTIQRFGSIAITFISNVVLARLLTPSDFGCVGMLMIFINLSNTFIDGGFGSALIQKKKPTNEDYSTIFFWNLFLSVFLYILLYISAPHIAEFYRTPILSSILKVNGIVLILNALNIIQLNQLRKQLCFKKLAIVEVLSALISLICAITAALVGLGIWSLVIQQIMLSFLRTVLLWILNKWRPLIIFSFRSFRELFNFGSYILLSNLFGTFSNEIQGLFVGRMFNPSTMGLYTQAFRLEGSMSTIVSGVINQVAYPVMSDLQDNREKLISATRRFTIIPAYLCSFIMGLVIVIAKPLIIIIFGYKWIDCVPYFQILCVAGLAVCLQGSANSSIAAVGKSKVFFRWTILKRSITVILCICGILLGGMYGLLWMCVLGAWLVHGANAYLVDKHIGYSLKNQISDILPFILLSAVDGLIVYIIGKWLDIGLAVNTIIQIIIYIIIFIATSQILQLETYIYTKELLKKRITRK